MFARGESCAYPLQTEKEIPFTVLTSNFDSRFIENIYYSIISEKNKTTLFKVHKGTAYRSPDTVLQSKRGCRKCEPNSIFGLCGYIHGNLLRPTVKVLNPESKKLEGDPKNVAEAFPHTGFDNLVCAEMIPLDS